MKSYEERAREILECRDTILYEKRMKRKKMEKCVAGVFCLCAVLAVSIKLYNTPELIKHNFNEQIIESKIGLENLSDELREIAELRLENTDMSLQEIGNSLKIPISRSGVNHRFKKLAKIADEIRGEMKNEKQ